MDLQQMLAIRNMISPNDDDDDYDPQQTMGSMFSPANIGGNQDKKEVAPPNAKVEAIVNKVDE